MSDVMVDKLMTRMYTHRFDQNDPMKGWYIEYAPRGAGDIRRRITIILSHGELVRTGYFATSIRGVHDYCILRRRRRSTRLQSGLYDNRSTYRREEWLGNTCLRWVNAVVLTEWQNSKMFPELSAPWGTYPSRPREW